ISWATLRRRRARVARATWGRAGRHQPRDLAVFQDHVGGEGVARRHAGAVLNERPHGSISDLRIKSPTAAMNAAATAREYTEAARAVRPRQRRRLRKCTTGARSKDFTPMKNAGS